MEQTTSDLIKLRKDIKEHQVVWARVERKKREVIGLEKRTKSLMRTLEKERSELETMVKEGREVVGSIEKVDKRTSDTLPRVPIGNMSRS